jgi:hypothetical protein
MMNGIIEYLQSKTTIPVMYGSHASFLSSDTDDEMCMPGYSSLIGTLLLGNIYRQSHPIQAKDDNLPILEILKQMTLDLFTEQQGAQNPNTNLKSSVNDNKENNH